MAEVLAPVNWLEVLPILLEAISWDEEVQDVLEFLQGSEFRTIVITVQGMEQYQNVSKMTRAQSY